MGKLVSSATILALAIVMVGCASGGGEWPDRPIEVSVGDSSYTTAFPSMTRSSNKTLGAHPLPHLPPPSLHLSLYQLILNSLHVELTQEGAGVSVLTLESSLLPSSSTACLLTR